ncbi:MAG TPA: glycyl-radical enzyme activating protein [Thermoleophilia bacterium]|nr:glycyl-radical enzyme activating protein [Thermoleophilia bacterium]
MEQPGVSGRVFDVQRFSLHDGPGIRTVVFLKGCPLRCAWCANPESQRAAPEIAWFENLCALCGRCVEACPHGVVCIDEGRVRTDRRLCAACGACAAACSRGARRLLGRESTVDEVMAEVRRDAPFFRRSGGGVTFSGGEPLSQPEFLVECLRRCRRWGYHTAVETCGQARWEDVAAVAESADLFLYDLKQVDTARHEELTGAGNELILANLERLLGLGAAVTVRVPVIPGANDDRESLAALADFVACHPGVRSVELLPYHPLGAHKYDALDLAWAAFAKPEPAQLEEAAAYVAGLARGVDCVVTQGLG